MGVLTDDAFLQYPPQPIPARELLPEKLPEAWSGESTTALEITNTLSTKVGKPLPWLTVREVIDGALRARLLDRSIDSGSWPCDYTGARAVKIILPREQEAQHQPVSRQPTTIHESRPSSSPTILVAEAALQLDEIQDLSEQVGELMRTVTNAGLNLHFHLRVELVPAAQVSDETLERVNELLEEVSKELRLRRE